LAQGPFPNGGVLLLDEQRRDPGDRGRHFPIGSIDAKRERL